MEITINQKLWLVDREIKLREETEIIRTIKSMSDNELKEYQKALIRRINNVKEEFIKQEILD